MRIDATEPVSLGELARVLGVSRQAVRQREVRILRKRGEALAAAAPARRPPSGQWIDVSLEHPARAIRTIAGLTMAQAMKLLGIRSESTLTTTELRGTKIQMERFVGRARAYGLRVRVQVMAEP